MRSAKSRRETRRSISFCATNDPEKKVGSEIWKPIPGARRTRFFWRVPRLELRRRLRGKLSARRAQK
jgi:hypothetical protein